MDLVVSSNIHINYWVLCMGMLFNMGKCQLRIIFHIEQESGGGLVVCCWARGVDVCFHARGKARAAV